MTESLFHSLEFMGVTMSRYGAVVNKDGSPASLELQGWIIAEARRSGWHLVPSDERDIGQVWSPPQLPNPGTDEKERG